MAVCVAMGLLAAACGSDPKVTIEPLTTITADLSTSASTSAAGTTPTTPPSAARTTTTTSTGPRFTTSAAWESAAGNLVGLSSECGNLSFLAVRPDRDELIVSVAKQGLWSTKDGSVTYARLGLGGSAVVDNRASQILFDPTNPDIFWESGTYGSGIFRTADGGKTFQRLGSIANSDPMSIDFTDPARATMLSGKHEDSALRRSTNGGATWSDLGGLPSGIGFATYPLVLDAKTYLVGTQGTAQSGIFRTADAGVTWTQVMRGDMNSPALVTTDGIYWLTDNGSLVRSTDQGLTWAVARPGFASPVSENMIRQLPDGRLYTIGRNVLVSSDKGANWTAVGPAFPYVPNGIAFNPFRNEFIIWRFDCDFSTNSPVQANSILKLAVQVAG